VKSKTRQVHVLGTGNSIQPVEQTADTRRLLGVDAPMISGLEEALQSLAPEANDHKSSVLRNIAIDKFHTATPISFRILA
jgi:hypothetical protein